MKKRMMSIMLVAVLSLTTITGCTAKDVADDVILENVQESSTQPTEVPTPEPTEVPTPEPTEAPTTEPTQASTPEPTAVTVVEATEAPASLATEVPADIDWSKAYDDYFERDNITYENAKIITSTEAEGMTFCFEVATAGSNSYMNFDFGTVGIEIYANEEKMYACTKAEGQEVWTYALIENEEDVEEMKEIGETVDTDSFDTYEYYDAVTEEGIVYDVLYITIKEEGRDAVTGYTYINRETQKITKMVMNSELEEITVDFVEIDGIEMPTEAMTAQEQTAEEILMTLFGVIMMGAMNGIEQ